MLLNCTFRNAGEDTYICYRCCIVIKGLFFLTVSSMWVFIFMKFQYQPGDQPTRWPQTPFRRNRHQAPNYLKPGSPPILHVPPTWLAHPCLPHIRRELRHLQRWKCREAGHNFQTKFLANEGAAPLLSLEQSSSCGKRRANPALTSEVGRSTGTGLGAGTP